MKTSTGNLALRAVAEAISVDDNRILVNDEAGSHIWQGNPTAPITNRLAEAIYSVCYAGLHHPFAASDSLEPKNDDWMGDLITNSVCLSNKCDWTWRALGPIKHGRLTAQRDGWLTTFEMGTYLTKVPSSELRSGDPVGVESSAVLFDNVSRSMLVRFRLFGEPVFTQELRVYLNVSTSVVPTLIHLITEAFSDWDIPFALKSPAFKSLYRRRDAVVIYV